MKLQHRWLFLFGDHNRQEIVEKTLSVLPRAQAAGFNGILFGDGGLSRLERTTTEYRENVLRLQAQARAHGLELVLGCMPIGYSSGILAYDPNLAEGLPVKDAPFVAREGALRLEAQMLPLAGGNFAPEGDGFSGWASQQGVGENVFADPTAGAPGGLAVRMETGKQAGLLGQVVRLRPFRQYHVRVLAKTQDVALMEDPTIVARGIGADGVMRRLSYAEIRSARTQDWTEQHMVFNSLEYDQVLIGASMGNEGGGGTVWWADMKLEEIGLMNVLRRAGCPIQVRAEDGTEFVEERDFAPIVDAQLNPDDVYHTPPTIQLTQGSRIREGDRVFVSYYHPVFIYHDQVVCCLSDPKVYEIAKAQVERMNDLLRPPAFLMNHDEIRVANWDHACQSRGLTPGQLVADNVQKCTQILRDLRPDAKIWVWSDMFDPFHNAVDGPYYLVNGSWKGSWEGLSPEVGILNWAYHLEGKNLKWFSDRGHEQILSGYYDGDEDGAVISRWQAAGKGLPGITGAMYTTWVPKYEAMEPWAKQAWGGGESE
jgi:hypothetical protein